MLNFRWGISILLGLTLVGCWNPTKSAKTGTYQDLNDWDDSNANFVLVDAQGKGSPTGDASPSLGLPVSRHYHFQACILNRANPQPIRGINFLIRSGNDPKTVESDPKGCLHWHEWLKFDPLGEEAFVQLDRVIEGIGVYHGTRKVVFAVDPWAEARKTSGVKEEVVWIRDDKETDLPFKLRAVEKGMVHSVLSGSYPWPALDPRDLDANGNPKKKIKRLWLTSVNSQIKDLRENPGGAEMEVMLNMHPAIIYYDMYGVPNPVPLKKGQFRVEAQVVASNVGIHRDENLILTPELPPTVAHISEGDGILKSSMTTVLSRRVPRGNLRLALKVTPIVTSPEEEGVEPFQGLYELGPVNHIEGKTTSLFAAKSFSEGDSFKVEEFLKNTSNFEKLKATRMAFDNVPYEFPKMTIKST